MSDSFSSAVAQEFDRLSELPDDWDFNVFHHQRLLDCLPAKMDALLDVGCGTGGFARAVAHRCDRVVGIDLSPGMIDAASRHEVSPSNIDYAVADVFAPSFTPASFDAIVSIAALHHMDLSAALVRLAALLRPGGTLLVLDLRSPAGALDRLGSIAAYFLGPLVRVWKSGRFRQPRAVRAAWVLHQRFDTYNTVAEVRARSAKLLPGSSVHRRLFWRYVLIWKRPAP